ncbi:MAG: hypothetical protein HFI72_07505 [Peptococcaceae bacterium]|jgi:hypothetical protein|nr:hypothetical protein [Peptococcaceae bacterium]
MSRYAIWNKQDPIITPIGEVLTAAQWKERYPVAALDSIKVVCAGGEINGAFFGTLGQMVEMYSNQGCDFSSCVTDEEKLAAIEAFEEEMNKPNDMPSAEERIAAAMEYQVMASLPDAE